MLTTQQKFLQQFDFKWLKMLQCVFMGMRHDSTGENTIGLLNMVSSMCEQMFAVFMHIYVHWRQLRIFFESLS